MAIRRTPCAPGYTLKQSLLRPLTPFPFYPKQTKALGTKHFLESLEGSGHLVALSGAINPVFRDNLHITPFITYILGRPLKYLIFSLVALIRDPIYQYFSKGCRGQPSILTT